MCIAVIVVVLDNIERGCDRFGKERATSWCQGWLLQEFSAAYRQGSDCHSWFTQVRFNLTNTHWFSYVLIFVLIILVPWEKLIIHLLEKITFSQFEWDIGGLNIVFNPWTCYAVGGLCRCLSWNIPLKMRWCYSKYGIYNNSL